MRPIYMGALKIFESLSTPTATFPEILMVFCSDRSRECAYKIFTFVPGIIGGTLKLSAVPGYAPRFLFSEIFNGLLFGWTL